MDWISTLQAGLKLAVMLAYAAFGVSLLSSAAGRRIPGIAIPPLAVKALLGTVVVLIWFNFTLRGYMFVLSAALGIAIFAATDQAWRSRKLVFTGAAVVILSISLAWWLPDKQPAGWWQPAAFALVLGCVQAGFMQGAGHPRRNWLPLLFPLFALAGFALLANMTPYAPGSQALSLLALHQGAYIGPALDIRAGLVPFYDIPLFYGLGPTLSIAAACEASNCWSGMAFLMVSSTLVLGFLILRMALSTHVPHGARWLVTATFVIFVAVFLWPGFSFMGSIPAASPSVGGLRFLPVTLVGFLLFYGRSQLAAVALVPAVLWSPEVAAMSLAVFGVHETARLGFVKAAIRSIAIAAVSLLGLAVAHHAIYGVWIQPDVFLEYVVHVPTPWPINPISDFMFLACALGLGAWNVFRPPMDALALRRDLVVTTLLYAAASYYLGRSHPNNVCNLMPFMALAALRSLDGKSPKWSPQLPRLTVAGLAASTAALALAFWNYVPFEHGFSTSTAGIIAAGAKLDPGLESVRSHISNPKHLGVADLRLPNRNPGETIVWTPMDPSSLWISVPHDRRQLYIKRSAARLRRPGWVVLGKDHQDWLNDFRVAYRITEETGYKIQSANSKQPETYVVAYLTPLDAVGKR